MKKLVILFVLLSGCTVTVKPDPMFEQAITNHENAIVQLAQAVGVLQKLEQQRQDAREGTK